MSRPKLLDLFCGAQGAGVGYSRAGFDVTTYTEHIGRQLMTHLEEKAA